MPLLSPSAPALRRSTLGQLVDQSIVLLMTAVGALILILALLILFHENANATKGYRLKTLEYERSQLLLEQEVVQMQVAQEQALESLRDDRRITSMIPLKNPVYVDADRAVAYDDEWLVRSE